MPRDPSAQAAALALTGLAVPVYLGFGDEERRAAQIVSIDLELRFRAPPPACRSDRLADTVDYGALAERLEAEAASREFRLLEHLAQALFDVTRAVVGPDIDIAITATKRPPLRGLAGGASFRLGDWPAPVR